MKEEVSRICKLVAEGRLSAEDAADLIDAFYGSERLAEGRSEEETPPGEAKATPPPPPPSSDPFRSFVESIEKLTKEGFESVNWHDVAGQARQGARKGIDAIRAGLEDISKGKIHLGWLTLQEEKLVTLPLTMPEGRTLKIDNPCGSVKVSLGVEGSVKAKARFRAPTLDEAKQKAHEYTVIVEESDHLVQIRQPDVTGLAVDLEVITDRACPIEIRSESGSVHVSDTGSSAKIVSRSGSVMLSGLEGSIEVTADSGDVRLSASSSPSISIENKSGSIDLENVSGNAHVRTASGNISVAHGAGKSISLETVSGNISLSLDEAVTGSVNVRTVSGNASVAIPDLSDCRVGLSTLRGNVESSLELSDEARMENRLTGRLGDGAGTLDVSAVTGNVQLEMKQEPVSV